ncbi:hypothetical protein B0T20DRAFT_153257 [Sordaria brevicollis]|uniref:Uncharacterized protein n=1 Tax=Sordaria brevicollis TaxID=83679 RepID=A0AAE0UE64_SORBR|nr:hypothetical protein B0T20DRAFT_153257 [Sordaria brevicollis]
MRFIRQLVSMFLFLPVFFFLDYFILLSEYSEIPTPTILTLIPIQIFIKAVTVTVTVASVRLSC